MKKSGPKEKYVSASYIVCMVYDSKVKVLLVLFTIYIQQVFFFDFIVATVSIYMFRGFFNEQVDSLYNNPLYLSPSQ